jgi:hypothetical protein
MNFHILGKGKGFTVSSYIDIVAVVNSDESGNFRSHEWFAAEHGEWYLEASRADGHDGVDRITSFADHFQNDNSDHYVTDFVTPSSPVSTLPMVRGGKAQDDYFIDVEIMLPEP